MMRRIKILLRKFASATFGGGLMAIAVTAVAYWLMGLMLGRNWATAHVVHAIVVMAVSFLVGSIITIQAIDNGQRRFWNGYAWLVFVFSSHILVLDGRSGISDIEGFRHGVLTAAAGYGGGIAVQLILIAVRRWRSQARSRVG